MAITNTFISEENNLESKQKLLTKIPITRTKRPINTSKILTKTSTFCKICSKNFVFPSELSKHLIFHDGKSCVVFTNYK